MVAWLLVVGGYPTLGIQMRDYRIPAPRVGQPDVGTLAPTYQLRGREVLTSLAQSNKHAGS
jgi:hypothetical protein